VNIINVGYDSTNYYMIEQGGSCLLVDVGWPGTLAKLQASLKRKRLSIADIGWLWVTHYHPDHAGLVQELKDQRVRHLLLQEQLPAVEQLKNYMKPTSGYVEIRLEGSLVLRAGESRAWLTKIGLAGELVPTPGHSFDSISLVLDEGMGFTGDLLPPALATEENAAEIRQSWNHLRSLNVHTIYPGHGPVRPMPV
jgi:endoribonuclease LACTB2